MSTSSGSPTTLPIWLRWAALAWVLVWLPVYWRTWGGANFLHLCDLAVILTCIAIWTDSALLISSQAISSPVVDALWALDAGWTFFSGHHLLGGTEYLFDPSHPLWIRLLTLFHVVLPVLLLWAIHRTGYDKRGFALQSAIALFVLIASRFTSPSQNINFAFTDPFFHRALGPPPVHIAVCWTVLVLVAYLPTHWLLKRFFPPAGTRVS